MEPVASVCPGLRLKEVTAAADAAAQTMKQEIAADVSPPPSTDPKIAVMNLIQVPQTLTSCSTFLSPTGQPCRIRCAAFWQSGGRVS